MIKPAKSKWPSIQFIITCHTCNEEIKITLHYGESTTWGAQVGSKFAEWAGHDGHDIELKYDFYNGRQMQATGR